MDPTPSNNVIAFPKTNPNNVDPEEINFRLHNLKTESVDDAMAFIIPPLFEALHGAGFHCNDDIKNLLLIECIRSIMNNSLGLEHPLDDFIETHEPCIVSLLEECGINPGDLGYEFVNPEELETEMKDT